MKKLKFAARQPFLTPPTPATEVIADWYKKAPKFPKENDPTYVGFKSCVPFLDAMTSGYMLTTPCDIKVEQRSDGPAFRWRIDWDPVSFRDPEALHGISIPTGYSEHVFAWYMPFVMTAEKNVSLFVTHPLNRYDLPFLTTSGIVDMTGALNAGHMPFFIRSDFEGIIKEGTPYAQITPFVRNDWQLVEDQSVIKEGDKTNFETHKKFFGFYRDSKWAKKTYKGVI